MIKKASAVFLASLLSLGVFCSCNGSPAQEPDYEPKSYAEMQLLHTQSDGTQIENFREQYIEDPFFSDVQDSVTYTVNAMYDIFTLANKWYSTSSSTGQQIVHRFGGTTPKYFEWMAQKSFWTDDTALKEYVRTTLINYPIMQSGQFWTWHMSPRWPVSAVRDDGSYHYDDQFRFVSAVKQIMTWEQSTDILSEVDTNAYTEPLDDQGNEISAEEQDVSFGKTVREKLDMAVGFIMDDLHGEDGLIILPEENSGRRASKSSNYFDSYAYGNKSAYENQLFYHMLGDLAQIETMVANSCAAEGKTAEAESARQRVREYNDLREEAVQNFRKEFWDAEKQRFIATIDLDGVRWDFGMVTQNLEAVTYGAADEEESSAIMSWINGTRTIEGDTSTGADIYEHKIAPRTNTLKIETSQIREDNEWKYWWHGMPEINPATNQKWNESQVNGGILFWTSYYDLMSRFKVLGAENAMNRYKVIADEYEVDLLFRDPANATGNKWKLGVIDEFPESGLVPLAYLNGMLGIDAGTDGLIISPQLPKAYAYAGIKRLVFGGNTLKITVRANGGLEIKAAQDLTSKIYYTPMAGEKYTLQYLAEDGSVLKTETLECLQCNGGSFALNETPPQGCRKLVVEPINV